MSESSYTLGIRHVLGDSSVSEMIFNRGGFLISGFSLRLGGRSSVSASNSIPQLVLTEAPLYQSSVIIVSFNTREMLRECLLSVQMEAEDLSIEVLVVDNGSSDGSPEMVEQEFPGVCLIRAGINLGFGAANNLALQRARGRYFVLLNSDAFLQHGALALAMRHMEQEPRCGLGGGRLIGRDGHMQPSARRFHTVTDDVLVATGLAAHFSKSRFFGRFDRTWANDREPAEVDWIPGAFCILRPEALARAGLFNPAFFLYYEEVDLCIRIKRMGYSVWYWPDVSIVHVGGESSRQLTALDYSSTAAQVVLWRMRSTLLYYRLHHGWKVHIARWTETGLYALRFARNRFSRNPARQQRVSNSRVLMRLMDQAWMETKGGFVSPPRPW